MVRRPARICGRRGPSGEARSRFRRRIFGWNIDNSFDVFKYGAGVMVVRVEGLLLSLIAIALTTPVDDSTSEMRMLSTAESRDDFRF